MTVKDNVSRGVFRGYLLAVVREYRTCLAVIAVEVVVEVVFVVVALNDHVVNEGGILVAHGYPADNVLVLLQQREELLVYLGVLLDKLVLLHWVDGDAGGAVVEA